MTTGDHAAPRTSTPLGGVRPSSARALLLVLLGEYVWPTGRPAWSSTILTALADLDVEDNAARKALQRTADSGITATARDGRRVRWSISRRGSRILASGWERTYGWHTRDTTWDGRWLLLSVTVPETQRRLRHHLQTRLIWSGLGSPTPGQWLTTHWERGDQVAEIVRELGLEKQSHSFVGEIGPVGDTRRLVDAAWDLDELRTDYLRFLDTYRALRPRTDRDCFRTRVALVQDWRRFPYLDPDLPRTFLPPTWPGFAASALFTERYAAWRARSARYWSRIESAG